MADDWFRGKTLVFKLTNTSSEEVTAIWKGWSYRDTEIVDAQGNEMKFPMKEGELTGTDGVVYDFDQIKEMDKKKFKELFPYFSKNTTFIREVDIGGNVFKYEFKLTINKEIEKLCLMNPGEVPKACFKQVFNKDLPPAKMYQLEVVSDVDANNWLVSHNSSSDKPIGPIPKRIQLGQKPQVQPVSTPPETLPPVSTPIAPTPSSLKTGLSLTELEQKLLTAIKGMGSKFDEKRFVSSYEQTYQKQGKEVDVERVKKIFNEMYN